MVSSDNARLALVREERDAAHLRVSQLEEQLAASQSSEAALRAERAHFGAVYVENPSTFYPFFDDGSVGGTNMRAKCTSSKAEADVLINTEAPCVIRVYMYMQDSWMLLA